METESRFCFPQAVQKVGLIGLAIGKPNKASEALIKAAANPQPEKEEDKKVRHDVHQSLSRNHVSLQSSIKYHLLVF